MERLFAPELKELGKKLLEIMAFKMHFFAKYRKFGIIMCVIILAFQNHLNALCATPQAITLGIHNDFRFGMAFSVIGAAITYGAN